MILDFSLKLFAACTDSPLFGLPHWATGLEGKFDGDCNLTNFALNDVWAIVGNLVRIALGVAGYLAVIFVIIGGIMFITSQGEPERLKTARGILTNAVLGLVIAVLASAIVGFIAGRF